MIQHQSTHAAIREGEPPYRPGEGTDTGSTSDRASPEQPSFRGRAFMLATLLLLSFMGITAFIYVVAFPMGQLFVLYATHFPPNDRSGWGPWALMFGLVGIFLLYASVFIAHRTSQFLLGLVAWLSLSAAAMALLLHSEHKLPSFLTAIPYTLVSVAWFYRLASLRPSNGRPLDSRESTQ